MHCTYCALLRCTLLQYRANPLAARSAEARHAASCSYRPWDHGTRTLLTHLLLRIPAIGTPDARPLTEHHSGCASRRGGVHGVRGASAASEGAHCDGRDHTPPR
eukprot:scaffold14224_cov96-Isochrysis_galbana.AAC.3